MELHHIGIAVTNIEATAKFYCTMGYVLTETIEDKIQNVYIAFLENERGRLELVQSVDKTSPVCNILKKIGVSAYHFCYETNDFYSTIIELEKTGFKVVVAPVNAIAFNNRKISFLYHADVGLIELLEKCDT